MSRSEETYRKAIKILAKNSYIVTIQGKTYRRSIPSLDFYRHQWFWDSCTHMLALNQIHPTWAYDDAYSLLAGQWKNGLIGHITFNPDEENYFPGPQFWGTEKESQHGVISTGIIQPPLLAMSVGYLYAHAKDRKRVEKFIEDALPGVVKYHQYLKTYRDPEDCGLISIVHPWESGEDNSPLWDEVLATIKMEDIPAEVIETVKTSRKDLELGSSQDRPQVIDYNRYIYLVDLYKKLDWDYTKIIQETPFAVKEVHTNSIWARANEELGNLLTALGREEEGKLYLSWATQTRKAIQDLWDPETQLYTALSVGKGREMTIREDTLAQFMPFYANAVREDVLPVLLKKLTDPQQYWSVYPIPSVPITSPKYEVARYWRGPMWPITNYFLIDGLNYYKDRAECKKIQEELLTKTLSTIEQFSFHEHYDPLTGIADSYFKDRSGMGFQSFTWSAAIYIYLVNNYKINFAEPVL